ncbi:MAG: hypothetical protein M3512_18535 [Bacteroidota bacterium]|nr:hypothetical protein [Bacteroidota bacterium]
MCKFFKFYSNTYAGNFKGTSCKSFEIMEQEGKIIVEKIKLTYLNISTTLSIIKIMSYSQYS